MMQVLHLDPFFDNPTGQFPVEMAATSAAGGTFRTLKGEGIEAIRAEGEGATIVLVRSNYITPEVLDCLPDCRAIVRYGIGLDRIDLKAAEDRNIAVYNTPDFCTPELADHTMALLLSVLRGTALARERLRSDGWSMPSEWCPPRLADLNFCLAGFGRIAREVAKRAKAFGCRIFAYDPFAPQDSFQSMGVESVASLDELLERANVLSLHCPVTDETHNMMDGPAFSKLPEGAYLINSARGELVETPALLQALNNGQLAGAGLDVAIPEPLPAGHPLRDHPRVVLTPHVAWNSASASRELSRSVARRIESLLRDY